MRQETTDKTLEELALKLSSHFQPTKIFLFGSHAKGTANPTSDYDFLIVVKASTKTPLKRMQEANRVLIGRKVPVDVFILTEEEFNEWKDEVSSVAHTALTQGLELKVG